MAEDGVDWQETDQGWDKAVEALRDLSAYVITAGVHGTELGAEMKGDLTMAQLAAVHEFGATIEHPGGTPYIVRNGKAIFLRKGSSGPSVQFTKPHKIVIPQRSFLRATVDEGMDQIQQLINEELNAIVQGQRSPGQSANRIGLVLQGMIQKRISDGIAPANAAATIKRKGSDKPLVDTGVLKGSITFLVRIGTSVIEAG